jgi:hypothetical protein
MKQGPHGKSPGSSVRGSAKNTCPLIQLGDLNPIGRANMHLKTMVKAVTTAAVLTAVSAGLAAPASADEAGTAATTITWGNLQASFDNNPGNGAESWLWAWAGGSGGSYRVDYQHYDSSIGSVWVNSGQGASVNPSKDIWRVRGCWWDNRSQAWGCHGWS